ncbi:MAG: Zn-dependent hydrolase, partial [Myxococcota bacterium]
ERAAELTEYTEFQLTADMSHLSDNQRAMVKKLIEASTHMEAAFWRQAYGDKDALLSKLSDPELARFANINFGPWDRLKGTAPFLKGVGEKPLGAQFYPEDVTKAELEAAAKSNPELLSLYTMVQRDKDGQLMAVPYSEYYAKEIGQTVALLREAAELAEDPGFKGYLSLRAKALESNEYFESDMAWMETKTNPVELVLGPIENYEDQLMGAKAAFEAYVLIKDLEWSKRLQRYAALLPELQRGLPVDAQYKQETPGTDSDLNAYDVVYYAGDCNAGSKTIAINLPNDEKVQLAKGTRRLQLKNAMRAKFDKILVPMSKVLVAPEQRSNVSFDAFFANTMFHEVAHGLGIKNVVGQDKTVREALGNRASALEEGKADVLGLYMIESLHKKGELEGDTALLDYYVTFVAGIFRSIRFGAASAHGRANLVRFNFFKEQGAFTRSADGLYTVDPAKLHNAVEALSQAILTLQGDGDMEAVESFVAKYGQMPTELESDLKRIADAQIPVDIVFDQGTSVLGL